MDPNCTFLVLIGVHEQLLQPCMETHFQHGIPESFLSTIKVEQYFWHLQPQNFYILNPKESIDHNSKSLKSIKCLKYDWLLTETKCFCFLPLSHDQEQCCLTHQSEHEIHDLSFWQLHQNLQISIFNFFYRLHTEMHQNNTSSGFSK